MTKLQVTDEIARLALRVYNANRYDAKFRETGIPSSVCIKAALQAVFDSIEQKQIWYKPSEKLPEPTQDVIIWKKGAVEKGWYDTDFKIYDIKTDMPILVKDVGYWQPFFYPPTPDKKVEPEPQEDGWISWNGDGEDAPVSEDVIFQVKHRNGYQSKNCKLSESCWRWKHLGKKLEINDIIAYRIIQEPSTANV